MGRLLGVRLCRDASFGVRARELKAGCGISCLTGHGLKFCPAYNRTWLLGVPAKSKKPSIFCFACGHGGQALSGATRGPAMTLRRACPPARHLALAAVTFCSPTALPHHPLPRPRAGKGAHGSVFAGTWRGARVAVKVGSAWATRAHRKPAPHPYPPPEGASLTPLDPTRSVAGPSRQTRGAWGSSMALG